MDINDLYINSNRVITAASLRRKRELYGKIDWDSRMVCIRGARGVGKTTLLRQYAKERGASEGGVLLVSLDDFWFTNNRLIDLADYHYAHGGKVLLVDEVHHYPYATWAMELKNAYDRYPGLQIVFTGSSILQMDHSQADLSRRCVYYSMHGLSFREYLSFYDLCEIAPVGLPTLLANHVEIAAGITSRIKVLPAFAKYLHTGYYPFYAEVKSSYATVLRQIASTVIDTDLPSVEKIEMSTVAKLKRLFALVAQNVPLTVNVTSLASLVEAPRQTVGRMLVLLQRAALLNLLYSSRKALGQLAKPEKVYMENPNIMYALTPRADIGNIRETFFANSLMRSHEVAFSGTGDFFVDQRYTFEVGGRNKGFAQISNVSDSYLAVDDIEAGFGAKIPLWMFGLLE